MLTYHIREGQFGGVQLHGPNLLVLGVFEGNLCSGDAKCLETLNPPGSEVGPGGAATWGWAVQDRVNGLGLTWVWEGKSSKHIPFAWSGLEAS